MRRVNICILVCYKKADKILWHFSPQNAYNHYKLCADEKSVSSSFKPLGYLKGIAFEILVNFGEIRENTSMEKFANSLFVKINPRQNKHSDFAKVSRICTN